MSKISYYNFSFKEIRQVSSFLVDRCLYESVGKERLVYSFLTTENPAYRFLLSPHLFVCWRMRSWLTSTSSVGTKKRRAD